MTEEEEPVVIRVYYEDRNISSYRTLKFTKGTRVAQAVNTIQAKCVTDSSENDKYGLFLSWEDKGNDGVWLEEEAVLGDYGLTGAGTRVELKKLRTVLVVTDLDSGHRKKLHMDLTQQVGLAMPDIGKRFGVSDVSEFALQVLLEEDHQLHWLDSGAAFYRQQVDERHRVVFRKKYYVTDLLVTPKSPALMHLVYLEARDAVISGRHPLSYEQALQFAALQMQITYSNYDPLLHVAGFLSLAAFMPAAHRQVQFVEEDIYAEHRKFPDLDEFEAKHRYVKICGKLPTFGATYCPAKEKTDHDLVFGVNSEAILSMHPDTKEIVGQNLLVEVVRLERDGSHVALKFKNRVREFVFATEEHAVLMTDLIRAYKDFQRTRKKEKYGTSLYMWMYQSLTVLSSRSTGPHLHEPERTGPEPVVDVLGPRAVHAQVSGQWSLPCTLIHPAPPPVSRPGTAPPAEGGTGGPRPPPSY